MPNDAIAELPAAGKGRLAAFLLLAAAAANAPAFEQMPEYRGVTLDEERALDDPMFIDGEYSSDYLTYQHPFDWGYDWLVKTQAVTVSAGSLAPRRFQINIRLKVDQEVLPGLHLRFLHLTDQDLEENLRRDVIEMAYFPSAGWGFAVYGEPTRYKKEDSAGVALLLRPSDGQEIRIFSTMMELDHSRHEGDGSYTPDGKWFPMNVGVTGSWYSDPSSGLREYVTYSARWETPSDRILRSENSTHEYERLAASVGFQRGIGRGRYIAGEALCDSKREQSDLYKRTGITEEEWNRTRMLSRFQCSFPSGGGEIVPAFAYQYRRWESPEKDIVFQDFQPQFWYRFGEFGRERFRQRWSLGYEVTFRAGTDTTDIYGEDAPQEARADHRLNARYDMRFGSMGMLSLLFTFDADQFGSGETWEGGNGQLELFF